MDYVTNFFVRAEESSALEHAVDIGDGNFTCSGKVQGVERLEGVEVGEALHVLASALSGDLGLEVHVPHCTMLCCGIREEAVVTSEAGSAVVRRTSLQHVGMV